MLKLTDITKIFYKGTVDERISLDNLNLQVDDADFITIIGSNGAGKSTLFNAISGSFQIDSGKIELNDVDITNMQEYRRAKYIGRLFQDPLMGTAPNMTILENLGLAYSRGSRHGLSFAIRKKDKEFFREKLEYLGIGLEDRLNIKVKLLSGGQRQALTLLMATMKKPDILLLDEHTAALDPIVSEKIMRITNEIVVNNKITTLMITHNVEQALHYGNRTVMIDRGKIVFELDNESKRKITPKELIDKYTEKVSKEIGDRMLFSTK